MTGGRVERLTEGRRVVTSPSPGPDGSLAVGGTELIRVVVRASNFDKIAHKIDKMGDNQPEIIYENASVADVDPRDDAAIDKLNAAQSPQFVTVKR